MQTAEDDITEEVGETKSTEFEDGRTTTDRDNVEYFRQCYRQPELLLPWNITVPQPDIVALQKSQPRFFASPVLDAGAGFGDHSIWLSTCLGLDVVACDVGTEALQECGRRYEAAADQKIAEGKQVGEIKLIECDMLQDLPTDALGMGPFATIIDSGVFHCIGGPTQQRLYVDILAKRAKPNAHMVLLAYSDQNSPSVPQMRSVSRETLHTFFNPQAGWEVVELQDCRYCQVGHSLGDKPKKGFALKALLMVARRLGESGTEAE